MRSVLKKLSSPWDERKKLVTAGLACAVGLIAALLLPLAFRAAPGEEKAEENDRFTLDDKAALFSVWWYEGDTLAPEVEHIEPGDSAAAAFCAERMEELTEKCIDDAAFRREEAEDSGEEYVNIKGEDGTLRLCRMWLRARGDWQNWLDVCFDADTGMIYYLYLRRECLDNRSLYARAPEDRPTAESVATGLAREYDGELRRFLDNGAGGTALILCDGGSLCYTIGCVYSDTLVDIRISAL